MFHLIGTNDEPMGGCERLFWGFVIAIVIMIGVVFLLGYYFSSRAERGSIAAVKRIFVEPGRGDPGRAYKDGLLFPEAERVLGGIGKNHGTLKLVRILKVSCAGLGYPCETDVVLDKNGLRYHVQLTTESEGTGVYAADVVEDKSSVSPHQ